VALSADQSRAMLSKAPSPMRSPRTLEARKTPARASQGPPRWFHDAWTPGRRPATPNVSMRTCDRSPRSVDGMSQRDSIWSGGDGRLELPGAQLGTAAAQGEEHVLPVPARRLVVLHHAADPRRRLPAQLEPGVVEVDVRGAPAVLPDRPPVDQDPSPQPDPSPPEAPVRGLLLRGPGDGLGRRGVARDRLLGAGRREEGREDRGGRGQHAPPAHHAITVARKRPDTGAPAARAAWSSSTRPSTNPPR
jgi:hypothetical protein